MKPAHKAMIATSMLLLFSLAAALAWGVYRQIARPPPFYFTSQKYLPEGRYEVRSGATALSFDPAVYCVPLAIAESCFKKGAP